MEGLHTVRLMVIEPPFFQVISVTDCYMNDLIGPKFSTQNNNKRQYVVWLGQLTQTIASCRWFGVAHNYSLPYRYLKAQKLQCLKCFIVILTYRCASLGPAWQLQYILEKRLKNAGSAECQFLVSCQTFSRGKSKHSSHTLFSPVYCKFSAVCWCPFSGKCIHLVRQLHKKNHILPQYMCRFCRVLNSRQKNKMGLSSNFKSLKNLCLYLEKQSTVFWWDLYPPCFKLS